MFYTGIGSRDITATHEELICKLAKRIPVEYTLRSGGATGSDMAFHRAALSVDRSLSLPPHEIYLPWNGLNNHYGTGASGKYRSNHLSLSDIDSKLVEEATETASRIHFAWNFLSPASKLLHTRNIFQVLGRDLKTPSQFLVCMANYEDTKGTPTGGTRTAWMLAKEYEIPCYNLMDIKQRQSFERMLDFFLI